MWFQDLLLLLLLVSSIFFIGIPLFKIVKLLIPTRPKNPLAEAKDRLERARLESEAANLNKETEKLYNKMYEEALQDEDDANIRIQQLQQQEKQK
jgi:hypothetical protein